ncbi:MAG: site-2 protease family protein [Zoogloeaceae bacterium]|jgi:Zn-dependent protease|nr:site-2 protease family protein [Zoogloeaceae bacterium]
MNELIATIAVAALPMIFAITLHEAAHGYVARYFGDPTAAQAGRITLNPVAHIDLVGTILIPAFLLLISGGKFAFGYAKPVPVNFGRLRHPKQDMFWVAAAGPFSNLLMAAGWMFLLMHLPNPPVFPFGEAIMTMCFYGVLINLTLMLLNLLPIPPLDGGRIVVSLLPMKWAIPYARLERYGMLMIVALLFIPANWLGLPGNSLLSAILSPLLDGGIRLLQSLF